VKLSDCSDNKQYGMSIIVFAEILTRHVSGSAEKQPA